MEKIIKNKILMMLLIILGIIILDILLNELTQLIVASNTSLATGEDVTASLTELITDSTKEWLNTDNKLPTIGQKVSLTVDKSGAVIFATIWTMITGIGLLTSSAFLIMYAKRSQGSTIRKLSLILASLTIVMGLFGVGASIVKMAGGFSHTFEYALTEADVSAIQIARDGMTADIKAQITALVSNGDYTDSFLAMVEYAKTMGVQDPETWAATQLFGDIFALNIAPKYGAMLGGNLGKSIGGTFQPEITEWVSGAEWEKFIIRAFGTFSVTSLLALGVTGATFVHITKFNVDSLEVPKY